MAYFHANLRFNSLKHAEYTLSSIAEAQGFRIRRVIGPFGANYENEGVASFKCINCSFFVSVRVLPFAQSDSPQTWVIYTINDTHSPVCLSRRRVQRNASVSTIASDQSSIVELTDDSDEEAYDEFGRPRREYVRSPSLHMPEPKKQKIASTSRRSATPKLPPPLNGVQASIPLASTSSSSSLRPKSPTPDPHAFSAYLENLLASLDQPLPSLDLSTQPLSTNELYEAVNQPLIGFQESGLDTHDFLTSLNKEQLDDLAPRLTRAVSVVQGVAPSSLMRPTQEMVNSGSFGISPAMLENQPVASTSAKSYQPNGHIANRHVANDFDYGANDFYDGTNGWDHQMNGDTTQQEQESDYGDEEDDDTHQMREETIPADVLDRELALAMHSPTVSPPPDPPDPAANGLGEHDAANLDSFFDIYQIFATYEEAENAILSNGRTEKMPLNIRWRPNPYARTNLKGACYECVRQCGYEIKLSDDAMEKWRVTSIQGQHEAQCYPSFRGKKTARSSRNRIPTKPSQVPTSSRKASKGKKASSNRLSPISSRAREVRSRSRSSSPSISVVARSDVYLRTTRVEGPAIRGIHDLNGETAPVSSPNKVTPAKRKKPQKLYAHGYGDFIDDDDLSMGYSPEKPITLEDEDDEDETEQISAKKEKIKKAIAANGDKARPTKPWRTSARKKGNSTKKPQRASFREEVALPASSASASGSASPVTVKTVSGKPYAYSRKRLPPTITTRAASKAVPSISNSKDDDEGEDEGNYTRATRSSARKRKNASPAYTLRNRISRAHPEASNGYTHESNLDDIAPMDFSMDVDTPVIPLSEGNVESVQPKRKGHPSRLQRPSPAKPKAMASLPSTSKTDLPIPSPPSSNMSLLEAEMGEGRCRYLAKGGYTSVRHLMNDGLPCNAGDLTRFREALDDVLPSAKLNEITRMSVKEALRTLIFEIRVRSAIIFECDGEMDEGGTSEEEESDQEEEVNPLPSPQKYKKVIESEDEDDDSDIQVLPAPLTSSQRSEAASVPLPTKSRPTIPPPLSVLVPVQQVSSESGEESDSDASVEMLLINKSKK